MRPRPPRSTRTDTLVPCRTLFRSGSGAEPGTGVQGCQTCHGHGKVRAQQGFFIVERTCPTCHGAGQVIEKPCRACRGEGRVDQEKRLAVNIPAGVDEGTRIRLSGEGERSEEHTSELQSLMRISYAVFCLKKKT